MLSWTPIAMVRILAFYLLGILLTRDQTSTNQVILLWIVCHTLALGFFISTFTYLKKYSGYFGLLTIIGFGNLNINQYDESQIKSHLTNHESIIKGYVVSILDAPEKISSGARLKGQIQRIKNRNSWIRAHSKVLIYLEQKPSYKRGDILLIKGSPTTVSKNTYPEFFNYGLYLNRQNIFFQHKLNSTDILQIGKKSTDFYQLALVARQWCVDQIKKWIRGGNEQAIAMALIVGQDDELEHELNDQYAKTGTLHVLSVSGLHTGILYLILFGLLKPVSKLKFGSWIVSLSIILCLWSYAYLTGLSPSVLRAVTMLSFVTIAKPFGLRSNIWNTLAASAFLLLLFDPWIFTKIGFQLSYLAVIGIVWIHPLLLNSWEPQSWWVFNIWNLTCVSISAQITTLPISLLYFHQFPIWFIPANLLIIPISSLALIIGILFLPLSISPLLAKPSSWVLSKVISFMNASIEYIGHWPQWNTDQIYVITHHIWSLFGMILGFVFFLKTKKKIWLYLTLTSAIIFGCLDHVWKRNLKSTQTIYIAANSYSLKLEIRSLHHFITLQSPEIYNSKNKLNSNPWINKFSHLQIKNECKSVKLNKDLHLYIINSPTGCTTNWRNKIIVIGPSGEIPDWGEFVPKMVVANAVKFRRHYKKSIQINKTPELFKVSFNQPLVLDIQHDSLKIYHNPK